MPSLAKVSKNNTTIKHANGNMTVTLHSTDIVHVTPSQVVLDNGGWATATTRARMQQVSNEYGLGYGVSVKRGEMFAHVNGFVYPFVNNRFRFFRSI